MDAIRIGIAVDKQISFKYFEYTTEKTKEYRHNGNCYQTSPFALTWDNENYYMIRYDSTAGFIKHYRVDRMENISVTDTDREGHDAFESHDMKAYTRRNFSMYGGEEVSVTMEFENHLVGVVMDRFGKGVLLSKTDDNHFRTSAIVAVSLQFYVWVFGLGIATKIIASESIVGGMPEMLASVECKYREQ